MRKMTEREMFVALVNFANGNDMAIQREDGVVAVTAEDLKAFAEKKIGQIDDKNAAARKRAEKKRAEGDALLEAVAAALTDEFATIANITAKVAEAGVDTTVGKVTRRLNTLATDGRAEKKDIKVADAEGKKRPVKGFRLPQTDAEADVE